MRLFDLFSASNLPRALLLTGLACSSLAGCGLPSFLSFPPQVRGNRVDEDQRKQLVVGTTTRADVQTLIGSPTTRAPFDDNTWIYIGEMTKPVIGATMEVLDQRVTVLTFDTSGVLRNVEVKTQADARPVGMVSRSTPSPGSDPSFLQQLLGNVGRFGPSAGVGGTNSSNGTNNRSGTGGSNF